MDKKEEDVFHEENFINNNEEALAETRLVRKLDTKLLPFLSFMYIFSSLDRSTLGKYSIDY